ncbi:MAG TPA: hypothetical protein DDY25_08020 [Peptococcaceae bacterium]|nr:hypothetical protein [Peptococcaceae bacterium]
MDILSPISFVLIVLPFYGFDLFYFFAWEMVYRHSEVYCCLSGQPISIFGCMIKNTASCSIAINTATVFRIIRFRKLCSPLFCLFSAAGLWARWEKDNW